MLLKRQSPLFNFEKLINFLLTIKIANGPMKNKLIEMSVASKDI